MVNASSKEEKIYGADFTCGGLFMALMMIAKEFTDLPMAFRLMINAKQKCWLERKKLFKR